MTFIIVSPYSPKWNNIASIRWEKLSKYLSQNNKVFFVTSKFPDGQPYRSFNVGNSIMIEIPLKKFKYNPYTSSKAFTTRQINLFETLIRRLKAEIILPLEILMPVSPGGNLIHDYNAYKNIVSQIMAREIRNDKVALITTYDPWFTLKLGNFMKKLYSNNIWWIADFRDPSFSVHESKLSHLPYFKIATRRILEKADMVLVVTKSMLTDYKKLIGDKVCFLPNGTDIELSDDYSDLGIPRNKHLTIVYTGSLHPRSVSLAPFIKVLNKVVSSHLICDVRFVYAGKDSAKVQKEFEKFGIEKILLDRGFVSHDEALRIQKEADLLLLIVYTGDNEKIGRSVRTGKVYEYLASFKPILAIAPKTWEMREEIEVDGVSKVFEKDEINEMVTYLKDFAEKRPRIDISRRKQVVEKYLYNNLAAQLKKLISEVLEYRKTK